MVCRVGGLGLSTMDSRPLNETKPAAPAAPDKTMELQAAITRVDEPDLAFLQPTSRADALGSLGH